MMFLVHAVVLFAIGSNKIDPVGQGLPSSRPADYAMADIMLFQASSKAFFDGTRKQWRTLPHHYEILMITNNTT